MKSSKSIYFLHAITIFLSAFLIFQVQPMLGKYMLPYFGGTTSVWAVSLLFFTTALFVGYFYAYLISRMKLKAQITLHLVILGITTLSVIYALINRSQIAIELEELTSRDLNPSLLVITALFSSIGLPYILLASTSPLFQSFYVASEQQEPYKLYAVSNAGSFIALFTYPFLFEPLFSNSTQQFIWGVAFLILMVLCVFGASVTLRKAKNTPATDASTDTTDKSHPYWKWLLFAILPSFTLVATTTLLTQKISPLPLLWIVPLAIYLLSFVVAFSGKANMKMFLFLMIIAISAGLNAVSGLDNLFLLITSICLFLFLSSTFCHSKLYELRPDKSDSSLFYVFTSLGGAIGALLASIVPPLVFNDFKEIYLAIILMAITAWMVFVYEDTISKPNFIKKSKYIVPIILIVSLFLNMFTLGQSVIFSDRNFYGSHLVRQDDSIKNYYNNQIVHGSQQVDENNQYALNSYYYEGTGANQVISWMLEKSDQVNVGVVGLGVGTIASFCSNENNVSMKFYEIDALVEKIARKHFTYLDKCDAIDVEIGDGRLVLQQELDQKIDNEFDVLVLDAFSGGSVPTHLLTSEAIGVYKQNLRNENSILVFNITNAWLDLSAVLAKTAEDNDLHYARVKTEPKEAEIYNYPTDFILISASEKFLKSEALRYKYPINNLDRTPLWTDNYTNILTALKF